MYADRNLSLLCSHAINDIQDVSVGLGLQVVRLVSYGCVFKLDYVPMVPNLSLSSGLGYALRRARSTFSKQRASRKQQFYSISLKCWILKLRNLNVWEGELYHHFFSSALLLLLLPFSDLTCIET